MRGPAKVALVVGGYVAAVLVAWITVTVYIALTPEIDRVGSSGMTAFGDSLVFLMVFGILAMLPTGTALYWLLRRNRGR